MTAGLFIVSEGSRIPSLLVTTDEDTEAGHQEYGDQQDSDQDGQRLPGDPDTVEDGGQFFGCLVETLSVELHPDIVFNRREDTRTREIHPVVVGMVNDHHEVKLSGLKGWNQEC